MMFVDYGALDDCINPASYGEICVHCNACGRFDKATQKECALNLYKELLEERRSFKDWIEGREELQLKNIAADIKYFEGKIAELNQK